MFLFLVFNQPAWADSGHEFAASQAQIEDYTSAVDSDSVAESVVPVSLVEASSMVTPGMKSDLDVLKDHLFQSLRVDRRCSGVPESHMTTHRITHVLTQDQIYRFVAHQGIMPLSPEAVIQEKVRLWGSSVQEPPLGLDYVDITASWDSEPQGEADESNILGGYGELKLAIDDTLIRVPVVQASEERLSYYKAHLLESGDLFRFETQSQFPLFEMSVGRNYVPAFIMTGKGLYLEYHNEPHYHEPMDPDAGGVYLLARIIKDELKGQEFVRISGFKIPFGTAVYSEPWAIHDDATTLGNWRVGYMNAQVFSTALIRNQAHERVGIEFFEQVEKF